MAKKILYKAGDIVRIPLAGNLFGYGRILIMQSPTILIGLYGKVSSSNINLEDFKNMNYMLKKLCGDLGLKRKEWVIVGNIPLEYEEQLPLFWGKDALTDKLYLRKYTPPVAYPLAMVNFVDKPTDEKEIKEKDAQPDGLCGWKALEAVLKHYLGKEGII